MTTYCIDVIAEQIKQGHGVCLLWPGRLMNFGPSCSIRKREPYMTALGNDIASYELVNPLPVPLLNGIRDSWRFTAPKDKDAFIRFFRVMNTDVFHVHTLQGLPAEAIEACHELGVRTVFTTHDFFGICPAVSLMNHSRPCINDNHCSDCFQCNNNALSKASLVAIQSGFYRRLKDSSVVKKLRQVNNEKIGGIAPAPIIDMRNGEDLNMVHAEEYRELRAYYVGMLESMDMILGNSSLTLGVFFRYVRPRASRVLNVTHSAITDRKSFHTAHVPLRIGYLGPHMDSKGFFALRDACDVVEAARPGSFRLKVFFRTGEGERDYLDAGDPFTYDDLPAIMDGLDVLLVPSIRFETFGFTALEGMSFGISAIVSKSAGVSDLVVDGVNGVLAEPCAESLAEIILSLVDHPERVSAMSSAICHDFEVPTMRRHVEELEKIYFGLFDDERGCQC